MKEITKPAAPASASEEGTSQTVESARALIKDHQSAWHYLAEKLGVKCWLIQEPRFVTEKVEQLLEKESQRATTVKGQAEPQAATKPTKEGYWWTRRNNGWPWFPVYVRYMGGCGPEWFECTELMQSDKAGDWKGEWFGPIPKPSTSQDARAASDGEEHKDLGETRSR